MTEITSRADAPRTVFISYASSDALLANEIVAALERVGVNCWIAPRDVAPGALYADEIIHAITESKVVVLVLSASAIESPHVGKEVERASSKRRPIIAVRTDAAQMSSSFEYFLSESQWIDRDAQGADVSLQKIVAAVNRIIVPTGKPSSADSASTDSSKAKRVRQLTLATVCVAVLGVSLAWLAIRTVSSPSNSSLPEAAVTTNAPGATPSSPKSAFEEKSVAVLPFVDMSVKKDQEYFSDGLSEELIDRLTNVPGLRVVARTSSFAFKGKQTPIAEIGKTLRVAYILEGTVRKSGNQLRISTQLIRVDNGYNEWSETLDRKLTDIFMMQQEIAGSVVATLKLNMTNGHPLETVGTQSVQAYDLYLQGDQIGRMATSDAQNEAALNLLQQAIAADPAFAPAWAVKSQVLDDLRRRTEARRAAEQAIRLNPNLSVTHTAMARVVIVNDSDLKEAEVHLKRALEIDPNNSWALSWMGQIAGFKGEFDRGIQIFKSIISRDPANSERYKALAFVYFQAGQYDASLDADSRARELNPSFGFRHFAVAQVLLAKGDAAAALAELDRETDDRARLGCGCRILMYDALGRKSEADAALAKLENTTPDEDAYDIARVYAGRGQLDAAFMWFDRALRNHNYDLFSIKSDPLLKNVRTDPRYRVLLEKLNLA